MQRSAHIWNQGNEPDSDKCHTYQVRSEWYVFTESCRERREDTEGGKNVEGRI